MPTGIDRAERAYLDHFISDDVPVFGLMRTAFGYVLLDRGGMIAFNDRLVGTAEWGHAGILSRFSRSRNQSLMQALSDVRRHARARCLPMRLTQTLRKHLPTGFEYFNTGHSNLTERVLQSVKSASGSVDVLIHDVIPLEYPEYQRPDTIRPFRDKVERVHRLADRVIYNSRDTRQRTEAVMQNWGRPPVGIVSHLGTVRPTCDPSELPDGLPPAQPYFVITGTIEPRKNHAFLLDLWDQMGSEAPMLLICGTRGWNNKAVFGRLDQLTPESPIRELPNLDDCTVSALVAQSAGLLFPSHAEGFGLPPVEALQLGTRVLCNELAVLREVIGDHATFASVFDQELWLKTIQSWKKTPPTADKAPVFVGPNWADHFKTVLRLR
ncbi:MAG: glycosyltransferase [Sulfitobacter sp.]